MFTKLDLASSGYHWNVMEDSSIQKTAFCINCGHSEFLIMLFALCNAPPCLQRLMNEVFAENIKKFIAIYLDNVLVFGQNMDKH